MRAKDLVEQFINECEALIDDPDMATKRPRLPSGFEELVGIIVPRLERITILRYFILLFQRYIHISVRNLRLFQVVRPGGYAHLNRTIEEHYGEAGR